MKKRIMYLKSLGAQTIDQCLFGYKLGAYWVSITNFVTKKFLIETFFVCQCTQRLAKIPMIYNVYSIGKTT